MQKQQGGIPDYSAILTMLKRTKKGQKENLISFLDLKWKKLKKK